MCSLEHIQPHLPNITCLNLLIRAIPLNLRLVDMPPIGTSQLSHHLNKLLKEVVMIITINSHLHSNNKPGGPAAPTDNSDYYYGQQPLSYNQQGQGYTQDGYGGYQAQPQSGYGQPPSYDQQQGYASAPTYGSVTNTTLYTLTICIIVESPIRWIKRMGDNISNTWISRSVKKIPISMIPPFKTNFEIRICVVLCLRESEVCVASPCLECICNRVHGFN